MPYTYEIEPLQGLVTVVCTGDMTLEAAAEVTDRVMKDPVYRPTYACMVDLRRARFHILTTETRRLVDQNAEIAPVEGTSLQRGRTALVTGDEVSYGVARQYAAFASLRGIPVEAFRDLRTAADWLGIRIEDGQAERAGRLIAE